VAGATLAANASGRTLVIIRSIVLAAGLVATPLSAGAQTFPTGTPLRMVMSAFTGNPAPQMRVDYIQLLANATSGTYLSSVLDAGRTATWGNANWTSSVPAGTSMLIEVRGGNSAVPDGTWSNWSAISNGGAIGLTPSRYLQYRVTFITTDPALTPVLNDIVFTWQ